MSHIAHMGRERHGHSREGCQNDGKLIPDAGLVVFNNAGHYSFLDNPYQFAAVVKNFLGEEAKMGKCNIQN